MLYITFKFDISIQKVEPLISDAHGTEPRSEQKRVGQSEEHENPLKKWCNINISTKTRIQNKHGDQTRTEQALYVVLSSATIAIQACRPRHVPSDHLRTEKVVKSDRVQRRRSICRDRNPSPPAAECADDELRSEKAANNDRVVVSIFKRQVAATVALHYFQGEY